MTELIDAEIVSELHRILNFPVDRMIYGQLATGKTYWVRYNSNNPGVAELPYLTFFRTHKFHPDNKKVDKVDIIDFDDSAKNVKTMHCMLSYVIEVLTQNVADQNKIMKRFMFWASGQDAITITDANGTQWSFRIIPEDPEDNSDLEAEDEQGRVIRTTLTFQVESVLFERTTEQAGIILEILGNMHGYYGGDLGTIHIEGEEQVPTIDYSSLVDPESVALIYGDYSYTGIAPKDSTYSESVWKIIRISILDSTIRYATEVKWDDVLTESYI